MSKALDLDHSTDYANHRDHSAEQCKNGDRLILMLVAEVRQLRLETAALRAKLGDENYDQAVAFYAHIQKVTGESQ